MRQFFYCLDRDALYWFDPEKASLLYEAAGRKLYRTPSLAMYVMVFPDGSAREIAPDTAFAILVAAEEEGGLTEAGWKQLENLYVLHEA